MYAAGQAASQKKPCLDFLQQVADDKVKACSSAEVLQEILHRYRAVHRLEEGTKVYEVFRSLPIFWFEITPQDIDLAKDLLLQIKSFSSRDALHLAVMKNHQIKKIMTYDAGFLGLIDITVCLPSQY